MLYSSRESIALAPVYDMLTSTVYDDYAKSPPGMPAEGRSSWMPGKALERFLQTRCGVMPAQTRGRVERICEAIVHVTPKVVEAARCHPGFHETGKRMLQAWNAGMNSLRLQKTWSLPSLDAAIEQARFSDVREQEITKIPAIHFCHCERSAAIHGCSFGAMDRHGLRPRDDEGILAISTSLSSQRPECGICHFYE